MNTQALGKDRLFSLWYCAENDRLPHQFSQYLLLCYLATYLVRILTLRDVSVIGFTLTPPSSLFIAIVTLILFLLAQALLFLLTRRQFFIAGQIKIFRFTLMDQGVNYIISEVANPRDFTPTTSLTVCLLYLLICLLLVTSISFSKYPKKTLLRLSLPFHFYFFIFNLLLNLLEIAEAHILRSTLLITLLLALYIAIKNESAICCEREEKVSIAIITHFTLVLAVYLFFRHLFAQNADSYIFFFAVLIAEVAVGILLTHRQNMLQALEISEDDETDAFLGKVQKIAFDADAIISGKKKLEETELNAFVSYHQGNCRMVACPLLGEEAKVELKTPFEIKHTKSIARKARKHIELLLESKAIMDSDDIALNLAYLHYLVYYTAHKRKAQQLYNNLIKEDYNIRISYDLFKLNERIEQLSDDESMMDKNTSNLLFLSFNEHAVSIIEIYRKVCNILLQQKIDFSLLTAVTYQLSHERLSFDQFVSKVFEVQTYAAFRMLTIYAQCCRMLFQEASKVAMIERHLVNLIEKLDYKKQVEFQVGLVGISLSENCLGDIISINPYAESVFGFESKELIGKTVNNIMPITFAAYHDSLLKVFLRNRYKKVNGDERVLVAKHKNGMIFPIMLRLQRVIASADELIFIANIRRYKTRESPMMFIATPEGEVVDYSVGFQFYFMSKHSKKQGGFNVYQIAPSFEEVAFKNATQLTISYEYRENVCITVEFKSTPLAFFGSLEAYFLIGTKVREISAAPATKLPQITSFFNDLIEKESLRCHYNQYHNGSGRHFYSVNSILSKINPRDFKEREFTIPFLQLNHISNIIDLGGGDGPKDYAKGIKAIRLVRKHFEQVEEGAEFHSQNSEETQVFSGKRKMLKADQIKSKSDSLDMIQRIVWCLTCCAIFVNLCAFQVTLNVISNKDAAFYMQVAQYQVRQYLSDFILFSNFKNHNYSQQFYSATFPVIQSRLVTVLGSDQLSQNLKQSYFKLVYSQQQQSTLQQLFSDPTSPSKPNEDTLIIWYTSISFMLLLALTFLLSILSFKARVFEIYSYFLYLSEDVVLHLLSRCKVLSSISEGRDLSSVQSTKIKNSNQQNEENDAAFISKIKTFNNSSRSHDYLYILQFFAILALLSIITPVLIYESHQFAVEIDEAATLQLQLAQIQSESSVFILSSFMDKVFPNIAVGSNFDTLLQKLQSDILSYTDFEGNETLTAILDEFMAGDICSSVFFSSLETANCTAIANNIASNGLSHVLDYIYSQILSIKANFTSAASYDELIQLHFLIIEAAIRNMNAILDHTKVLEQQSFKLANYALSLVTIFLLLLQSFFLKHVPFKSMSYQIKLSYQIIELFQSIKHSALTPTPSQ